MQVPTQGSISHGTHRTVDLVPAFLDALIEIDRPAAAEIEREYGGRITAIRNWAGHGDGLDVFAIEEDQYLMEALFDALDTCAPEGTYFGAHEGDGADFGFWPVIE